MAIKQVGVAPSGSTDAVTKGYVDALQVPRQWGTPIAGNVTVAANTAYTVTGTGRTITFPAAPADGAAIALVGAGYPVSYIATAGSGDVIWSPGQGAAASTWTPSMVYQLINYVYNATNKTWYPNSAAISMAIGGTSGQFLTKKSTGDYDTQWSTPSSLVPAGGAIGAPLTKNSATDYDLLWALASTLVAFSGAGTKLNADLGNTYPAGISFQTYSNTQSVTSGWPCGSNYCQTLTIRAGDGGNGTTQYCMSTTNLTTPFLYVRSGNQNGWSAWATLFADTGWTTLPLASGFVTFGSGPAPAYRVRNNSVTYRGQVCASGGNISGTANIVTALPAGAQPTLAANGYVMCSVATGSNATSARAYITASALATITIGMGASATYVDLSSFMYGLG